MKSVSSPSFLLMALATQTLEAESPPVRVWVTDPVSLEFLLAAGEVLPASLNRKDSDIVFRPEVRFQTMEGFGASMTEASAVVIQSLSASDRDRVMKLLFDPGEGLGISLLRQPMGASDFASSIYSYDDQPRGKIDPELKDFSVSRDDQAVVPLLQQALALNPSLRLLASPWSPPAWMKSGETMLGATGGFLKPEFFPAYARYFVKFIEAYAQRGLPILAVTPQNEMDYGPKAYPGMLWTAEEEGRFIREDLGPALEKAGLNVKILAWDHNWDKADFAIEMLSDPATARYIAGTAWHYYGGHARAMDAIGALFPDKELWFTEGGSGRWIGHDTFAGQFADGIRQAVSITSHGAKAFLWWNLALDQNNGPVVYPNTDNYGLLRIDTAAKTVTEPYRACFYTLGHFSRFVVPGAVRIQALAADPAVGAVAFQNPDGTLVAVLANLLDEPRTVNLAEGTLEWAVTLPAQGAVTCVWTSPGGTR